MDKLAVIAQSFMDGLSKAASAIGTQAARVYPDIIRLYWMQNLAELMMCLTVVSVGWYLMSTLPKGIRTLKDGPRNKFNEPGAEVLAPFIVRTVVGGAFALIGTIVLLMMFSTWAGALYAPEASFLLRGIRQFIPIGK